jgi:2-enoate reductase
LDKKYEPLFQPLAIGGIEIPNRFLIAPMEGTGIVDNLLHTHFNEKSHDYYIERAKDGVGLMIPGMILLRSMVGSSWLHKHPKVFRPVKSLMDEIHSYGSKVFFQLGAGWGRSFTLNPEMAKLIDNKFIGTVAKPLINMRNLMVAPDEGSPNVWMPEYKCRAITKAEIKEFVEAYAQSALLCKKAGVDGVEVHAVHEGYLMDQFTLPYSNHRTDEYGGSFENRYRFAVEVVQAIKKLCGSDYPVSLRYSVTSKTKGFNDGAVPGEDFVEVGRTMEESERAIRYLRESGYDMFNCDNGTYDAWYWAHPPVYMPLDCNIEEVMHIKKFTDAPVFCAGRMQFDSAAEAIGRGKLDGVAMGRQFLCDHAVLQKIRENRLEDIRPCIACHAACLPVSTFKNGGAAMNKKEAADSRMCAVNPRTFNEKKYTPIKSSNPKKIAVIGGGIGGMEVAIQSALRGHTVTLFEKSNQLGGVFVWAAAPSFKEKDKELLSWYSHQLKMLPVTVKLNTEITSLSELEADEIVIATGAKARRLNIPGNERAISAISFLSGEKSVGECVAIIGGGLTGCEIAYELALQGKKPCIIEMMDDVIKVIGVGAPNSEMMRQLLKYHKVPLYLEAKVKEITKSGILIDTKEGEKHIEADSFITSIGYIAGSPLAEKSGEHLHIVGDARQVANLKRAIWDANDVVLSF